MGTGLTSEQRVICKVQTDGALVRRQLAFEYERRWLHLTQFFWGYENPFRWFHGHGFAGWAESFVFAQAHIMRREFVGWGFPQSDQPQLSAGQKGPRGLRRYLEKVR
jgi:hypothetical protein